MRSHRKIFQLFGTRPSSFWLSFKQTVEAVLERLFLGLDVLDPLVGLVTQFHHAFPTALLLEGRVLLAFLILLEPVERLEIRGDVFGIRLRVGVELLTAFVVSVLGLALQLLIRSLLAVLARAGGPIELDKLLSDVAPTGG